MKVYRPLEERNTPVRDCLFALLLIAVVIAARACDWALAQLKRFAEQLVKE